MVYDSMEFWGFEQLAKVKGREGLRMERVPIGLRKLLREGTGAQFLRPAGNEIRFVSDFKPVKLTLKAFDYGARAVVYMGDYQQGEFNFPPGAEREIELAPAHQIVDLARQVKPRQYAPQVVRVILGGGELHYIKRKGEVRPPQRSELPKTRLIAYGTSITHGYRASSPNLSYAKIAALNLGCDLVNLGVSGNAFLEKELADYIAERRDWDILTLCISVNMLNQGESADCFYDCARYFLEAIGRKNRNKLIFAISIIPFSRDLCDTAEAGFTKVCEYRNALRRAVEKSGLSNIRYIDGKRLLKNYQGLTSDLLHPGDYAMIEIGERLAKIIRREL